MRRLRMPKRMEGRAADLLAGVMFVLLAAVLAISLMPSKRSHQD